MAPEEQPRRRDVPAPPPEDWREAVCRRPAERSRTRVDADTWNEVILRRIAPGRR